MPARHEVAEYAVVALTLIQEGQRLATCGRIGSRMARRSALGAVIVPIVIRVTAGDGRLAIMAAASARVLIECISTGGNGCRPKASNDGGVSEYGNRVIARTDVDGVVARSGNDLSFTMTVSQADRVVAVSNIHVGEVAADRDCVVAVSGIHGRIAIEYEIARTIP